MEKIPKLKIEKEEVEEKNGLNVKVKCDNGHSLKLNRGIIRHINNIDTEKYGRIYGSHNQANYRCDCCN